MSDPILPPEPAPREPEPGTAPPEPTLTPAPDKSGIARRWLLAGGTALLLGGGAGVLAERLRRTEPAAPVPPPGALLAAVRAERALLADLDATTGGTAAVRTVIAQVRADHAAHLAALRGILAGYPSGHAASAKRHGRPRTLAQLHAAEQAAARTAAEHADALTGAAAALLASIAACEATHAELLR